MNEASILRRLSIDRRIKPGNRRVRHQGSDSEKSTRKTGITLLPVTKQLIAQHARLVYI
jgi:hypothetical protein